MVQVLELAKNKEAICYTCKSKLLYSFKDMEFTLESSYGDSGRERVARITCPVCNGKPSVPLNF